MLILPAEADESVVSAAIDRITKVISVSGGAVGNIDRWGRRRFAYEIADQNEGYYVVAKFSAEPSTQVEMERVLTLADEVIRFKVLALPKPSRSAKRPKGAGAVTTGAAETPSPAVEIEEASSPAPA